MELAHHRRLAALPLHHALDSLQLVDYARCRTYRPMELPIPTDTTTMTTKTTTRISLLAARSLVLQYTIPPLRRITSKACLTELEGLLSRHRERQAGADSSRNLPRPGGEDEEERPRSHFTGRGMTLGDENTPSAVVEDPRPNAAAPPPRVRRVLHLWSDGFSVDDGPLFRYDDPANAETLRMIQSGRAPLDLLNVQPRQEVDLELDPQKEQAYVKPKSAVKPFSGRGQRLGSPVPGASSSSAAAPAPAAAVPASSSSTAPAASSAPTVDVDDSAPTVTLQIRLGDGTRLQSRFNTTHTVGDIYGFVDRATPGGNARSYSLMTTFPSKKLEDHSAVLGDMSEFKRGGVVVQKWD
jgi:UBX domain-containing protein 1